MVRIMEATVLQINKSPPELVNVSALTIDLTNDEVRQVKHVSSYREAERTGHRLARRLEQHAVCIYGLRAILERMGSKILPILYYRLVLKQLFSLSGEGCHGLKDEMSITS